MLEQLIGNNRRQDIEVNHAVSRVEVLVRVHRDRVLVVEVKIHPELEQVRIVVVDDVEHLARLVVQPINVAVVELFSEVVAVRPEEIHFPGAVIHVYRVVDFRRHGKRQPGVDARVEAVVRIFVQDDVDDARHAFRIVFRARIGDEFDFLDRGRRDLPQQLRDIDVRRAAVHQNPDVFIPAQRYFSVLIHVYRRNISQDFRRRRAGRGQVFPDVDHFPVDFLFNRGAFGHDRDFVEFGRFVGKRNRAEGNAALPGGKICRGEMRFVTHELDFHRVIFRHQVLDVE